MSKLKIVATDILKKAIQEWETEDPDYFDDKETITEEDLKEMGFVPGGKLYVADGDSSIYVLLTNTGMALGLRTD